ncbi:MAG: ribonuclease T2 family protein [Devosia sp.]|jgi:ribonuclease T2
MKIIAGLLIVLAGLLLSAPASAQTRLTGTFTAAQACPALQSIKKATNPGNVTLTVGTAYKLIGGNKEPATYYWIVVPGASPDFRWVPVECGKADGVTVAPPPAKTDFVLAISWEPAFCEAMPSKAECKAETATSYDATHFSLHGLWPQPRSKAYCGVSDTDKASDKAHSWTALPAVDVTPATRTALDKDMPGTKSALERHEWIEHGTCAGVSQEVFFTRATLFADTIANSAVGALFASHIGQRLEGSDIRKAFDTAFGAGAGDRVRISCETHNGRGLLSEITIGLSGDVMHDGSIGELIAAAGKTSPGCAGGIVDAVGKQ